MKKLFNNLSISNKMYIVPLVSFAFLVAIAFYAISMFNQTVSTIESSVSKGFTSVVKADHLQIQATQTHADLYRLITFATSSADESDYIGLIDDHKKLVASTKEDIKGLSSQYPRIADLSAEFDAYADVVSQIYDMASDAAMSSLFLGDAQRVFDNISVLLKELTAFELEMKDTRFKQTHADIAETENLFILLVIVASILSVAISIVIARIITKPLAQISNGMSELSNGNHNLDLPSSERTDEIGDMVKAVNVFNDAMQESERLAREQQNEAIEKEERVHRVASLVDQSRGLADEVNSNVSTVAASVHEMSGSSEEIRQQTQRSASMVERAVDEGQNSEAAMEALSSGATKIGEVMAVINNIAEQTNLLALNASIEAARAGEAGRGFAVVADEVKKLAEQTSSATSDIQEQIQGVQTSVEHSVGSMQKIRDAVHEIEEVTTSITAAVEEQNSATHAISESMEQATQGVQGLSENINSIHETAVEN